MLSLLVHGGRPTWTWPETTALNRLPMRGTLYPFPDAQRALREEREASPWFQLLHDDQMLFAFNLEREGHASARTQRLVTLLDSQLKIMWIEIAPANDD